MPKQIAASPALDLESAKPTAQDSFFFASDGPMLKLVSSKSKLWRFMCLFDGKRIRTILGILSHNSFPCIPKIGGGIHA